MNLLKKLLISSVLAFMSVTAASASSFKEKSYNASGALFLTVNGQKRFICSGTEIPSPSKDYGWFLTAKHCVADLENGSIYTDGGGIEQMSLSGNQAGPFYDTVIEAISSDEDLAVLRIINGGSLPTISIGDEYKLKSGDPIFNWSYPLGFGKLFTIGRFMAPIFPHFPDGFLHGWILNWRYSMPMDILISPGSSGSGIFDDHQQALIGVIVGVVGPDGMKVAMPISRAKYLVVHKADNTLEAWRKAHPPAPKVPVYRPDDD